MQLSQKELSLILGMNVRALRDQTGLSQQAFADMIGLSRPTISRIERGLGNPLLFDLLKISNACGVSPETLLIPTEEGLDQLAEAIMDQADTWAMGSSSQAMAN